MNNDGYKVDYEFFPIDKYLKPEQDVEKESALETKIKQGNEIKATKKKGFLEEILTDKLSFLNDILDDITVQIKDREHLN